MRLTSAALYALGDTGAREGSKKVSKAIRAHNVGTTVAMVLLAVLVILLVALAFALRSVPTSGDREANPAKHAMSAGGSTITQDPYIERHAEVVQRLGN